MSESEGRVHAERPAGARQAAPTSGGLGSASAAVGPAGLLLRIQASSGNRAALAQLRKAGGPRQLARAEGDAEPASAESGARTYTLTVTGIGQFEALSFTRGGENQLHATVLGQGDESHNNAVIRLQTAAASGEKIASVSVTGGGVQLTLNQATVASFQLSSGADKPTAAVSFTGESEKAVPEGQQSASAEGAGAADGGEAAQAAPAEAPA